MSRYFGTAVLSLVVSLVPLFAGAQSYYYPSGYSGYSGYNSPVIYSVQPTYQQSYGYQYPQQYYYYPTSQQYYQPQYQYQQQQMQYQQYYQPQVQVQVQVQNQQQSQPSYYTPQQYTRSTNGPPSTGSYPTADRDAIGNQLCYYPSYGARYSCDSDPHQWVYDYWTGTWY